MRDYTELLYQLVGKDIELPVCPNEYNKGRIHKATWTVIAAYPYHIMAERRCENNYTVRESFGIGTLVTSGILSGQQFERGYYRHKNNGWGC